MAVVSRFNDDPNLFLVANAPYNLYIGGVLVFQVFEGQYFRWLKHLKSSKACHGCGTGEGKYMLLGYAKCATDFKDKNGNVCMPEIPDTIFEETYDNVDDDGVCESWWDETGGINVNWLIPPHERESDRILWGKN